VKDAEAGVPAVAARGSFLPPEQRTGITPLNNEMGTPEIDIIVPVWNRPTETRCCLVSLAEHSPTARLILVDNGSDRETERLLQEFAEILDDRALLLRNEVNQGNVKAVNRGLARAEAPLLAVVRNTTVVADGWLEPLVALTRENPAAGLILPRLVPAGTGKGKASPAPSWARREEDHGSLAAMLVKKDLFGRIGGFDEELDGGVWCLRDYTRRAYRAGFLTFSVDTAPVLFTEETPLGSVARREETARRSGEIYRERWGEGCSFCVYLPRDVDAPALRHRMDVVLEGARQGHVFTVLAHPHLHKSALVAAGFDSLHGNIHCEQLPVLFAPAAVRRRFVRLLTISPGIRAVTGVDGLPFPGVDDALSFARLTETIADAGSSKYHH